MGPVCDVLLSSIEGLRSKEGSTFQTPAKRRTRGAHSNKGITQDGNVQSVQVKTKDYTLEKPVNQLIPLEDPGEEEDNSVAESSAQPDPEASPKATPTPQSRGRPKGSKNKKKSVVDDSVQKPSSAEAPLGEKPKRPRGRPPKNPQTQPSSITKPSTATTPSTTTKPSSATNDARSRPYLPRQSSFLPSWRKVTLPRSPSCHPIFTNLYCIPLGSLCPAVFNKHVVNLTVVVYHLNGRSQGLHNSHGSLGVWAHHPSIPSRDR
ncbi:hypothetical protein B9Z55_019715 [Caenorhabditis nigoni]|uniref:Uncharacterized protein n=1 Tax=Caenorhabditis nigoni TaxID=1611254 RepID=A0A2G5TJM9_9PELO|nr:hypothetical protein B9Z55_019715 [Caenorhabditis nigoni]